MKVVRKRPATIHQEIANDYHNIVGSFLADSHDQPDEQDITQEEENDYQIIQPSKQWAIEDRPKINKSPSKIENVDVRSTSLDNAFLIVVLLAPLLFILILLSSKHTSPNTRQIQYFTDVQPISNDNDFYTFRQSALEF